MGTDGAGGREENPRRGEATGLRRRRGRCVAMMEAADKGCLNDSAQVGTVHRSRFRGVLVQGEVRPDAVGTVAVDARVRLHVADRALPALVTITPGARP